jgi:hypothetical protein
MVQRIYNIKNIIKEYSFYCIVYGILIHNMENKIAKKHFLKRIHENIKKGMKKLEVNTLNDTA